MSRDTHLNDEQLSARIDQALDQADSARMTAHLDSCRRCTDRLARLQATSRAVSTLPPVDPPRPVDLGFTRILDGESAPREALPSHPPTPRSRLRWPRTPAWAAGTLAVAAVLVLAIAVAPGLLRGGGGASTAARPLQGAAPSAASPPPNLAPAQGSAREGGPNAASVLVPDSAGMMLTLSTPARSAARGTVVPVTVRLAGADAEQTFTSYSITVTVAATDGASPSPIGSSAGSNLVVRGHASTDLTISWPSNQGTPGPGSYMLVAIFDSPGRSATVTIPVTLG